MKMLQKQISTGERASQDISKMLKSIVTDENSHLKGASKKLEDLVSSKHDFISKIHKNLDTLTKEIDDITTDLTGDDDKSFGVVPIRKMINGMATSMVSVHDMVEKLEASLAAVGIDTNAATETDMFREMDTRIGALTSTANHKACMEMRRVLDAVEKMMEHMETMMTSHTSSLAVPTVAHERTCVDDMAFDMDDFDGDFAGVLKGADVTVGGGGEDASDGRVTELYAEYHTKMKETNDMYKTLKSNYTALVKDFQSFQVKTLKDVSKISEYKSKTMDARNLIRIYKKFLGAQVKLNKEGMTKIEGVLQDLEAKVNKLNHTRKKDRNNNVESLKRLQDDLHAILAAVDVDETTECLEEAVTRSDAVLDQLRKQRVQDLEKVSETFRLNLEELRQTFPMAEQSRNSRKARLTGDIDNDPPTSIGGDGGYYGGYSGNTDEVNRGIGQTYSGAIGRYHQMVDQVSEERETLIQEGKVRDLERRQRAEKARIERQAAVEEHNHLRSMKRYGEIIRGKDEAKRKKVCKGTHVADSMTVGKLKPMPQMLVVRDHFRKAKIMPGVPEKHMKDMRSSLRDRWSDFVSTLFSFVTIVDNHGVKTWVINDEVVMSKLVLPFMRVRYGLKSPGFSAGLASSSAVSVRVTFNTLCDEFVTDLLLHSTNDDYKHLMRAFKPKSIIDHTTRPSLHDFNG